ncbi:MAG: agmatine deiminase family protein [Flavobacteriales bacterium]|nr:agmatine deiminase family protein [Flavobacteriales bacterium]
MKNIFVALALGATLTSRAQETPEPGHGLPHAMAPYEIPFIEGYRNSRGGGNAYVVPPTWEPRTTAEWEEVQAVVVTWTSFEGILKQIVRYAKDECEVIIACEDQNAVIADLNSTSNGGPLPNLDNISFLEVPFNSIWGRDYGAESMYKNEVDSLFLLDWIYNRPRPEDDAMPLTIANFLGLPIFATSEAPYDIVHTGGNFMADGFGTAFSSYLVYDENGPDGEFNQTVKTPAQTDALMDQWMGINQYITMPTLPYDAIHHIDMHMKLLDEERLLVGQFPVGVSDGPQIETNLQDHVMGHNSVFGDPYEVLRIPMPPSTGGQYPPSASYRTYANNIFLNKLVLVPTYREEYDTTGLRILREALPGYRVVGIDCDNSGSNIISQSGAIHCISKGIGVEDPLLIRHQRLRDTYETVNPYTVEGYIRHRTGITGAEVYWTTDTAAGFAPVVMTDIGGNNWSAAIPAQPAGSVVFYYIHATANSTKEQVRPIVAPDGWWKFKVLDINAGVADADGPVITEVFPNPTSSVLVVTVADAGSGRVRITLRDALGREVMRIQDSPMHQDHRAFADLSYLAEGPYMLVVESAKGRSTTRVVKD